MSRGGPRLPSVTPSKNPNDTVIRGKSAAANTDRPRRSVPFEDPSPNTTAPSSSIDARVRYTQRPSVAIAARTPTAAARGQELPSTRSRFGHLVEGDYLRYDFRVWAGDATAGSWPVRSVAGCGIYEVEYWFGEEILSF